MSRYPPEGKYPTSWVCFVCRKCFSRPADANPVCPDCGRRMRDAGKYFPAPKKQQKTQWQVVRFLMNEGVKWDLPMPPRPKSMSQAKRYLKEFHDE